MRTYLTEKKKKIKRQKSDLKCNYLLTFMFKFVFIAHRQSL